jgi:C-terminal processing protease CtpA/Prc
MGYIVDTLRPLPQLRLSLLTIDGNERQVDVITEYRLSSIVKYGQHQGINQIVRDFTRERLLLRPRYVEVGDALIAVQFPEFDFSADEVDAILGKMRKHKAVIFDLRDNPGGFESTLQRLVGCLFQYDIKMFDRVGRDSTKPVSASGRHSDAFTGRFAVLIDSKSASASELFARIVQLQRRGFVIGDRSSGKVMEAQFYSHDLSIDWAALYGASITRADLLMSDGKTLEHVGVEPDILILPTAQDLAASRDPVLAKACKLLGTPISPEEAGKFFPYQEPTEE